MLYEYLVRRAYNSGRNYDNGADADIYRKMERAHYSWQSAESIGKNKEDDEYEFRVSAAKVISHVDDALKRALPQIHDIADKEILEKMRTMFPIGKYDKKIIDEVIKEAGNIFQKNGLNAK